MLSAPGHLCDDQITFGDLRFDRELEIGKGRADALEMLFVAFNSGWVRGISIVINDLIGHEHGEQIKVAGVDDLSDEAMDQAFYWRLYSLIAPCANYHRSPAFTRHHTVHLGLSAGRSRQSRCFGADGALRDWV